MPLSNLYSKMEKMCWFCIKDTKAQAMVEAAIIIPVLLLLFLGTFYFGTRLYIQNRTYLACRYAASYLAEYPDASMQEISHKVEYFFPKDTQLEMDAWFESVKGGIDFIDKILKYKYLRGLMGGHAYVKITTYQAPLPYASPQDIKGWHTLQKNYPVQAAMPATDKWKSLSDFIKSFFRKFPKKPHFKKKKKKK